MEPPTYEWISRLIKLGLGAYRGGFYDRWEYNSIFEIPENVSEEEMWDLYKQMQKEHEDIRNRIGIIQ